jgi:predicted Zn-dependent peptidase
MIDISKLSNGLTLIVEEVPYVESVAYDLYLPGGIICDRPDRLGSCLILAELTSRGAGNLDSRALSEAFEDRGIRHGEAAGHDRFVYRGSLLAGHLDAAMGYVADMVRQPMLPEDELESIKSILIQDLNSLNDNPSRRIMVELTGRYYPDPHGRSSLGTEDGIESTSVADLQRYWQEYFLPAGSILSIAGKVNIKETKEIVEKHFGSWKGSAPALPPFGTMPPHSWQHIESDSAQMQIAFAFPSAKFGEQYYYTAKVASGVLSGGMFGRLFMEVREKRGLCYSVFARHSANKHYGTMLGYAGTTPERAHQTLEVMIEQLKSLKGTVTEEEISRAKANLKASLVIGEESAAARAGSNASEWWIDGKVRTLDEIINAVNAVTATDIDDFCARYPSDSFMLQTLGSGKTSRINEVMGVEATAA